MIGFSKQLLALAVLSVYSPQALASYCESPSVKEKTESADLIVEGKIGSTIQDDTGYVAAVVYVDQVKKGNISKKELTIYALVVWDKDKSVAGFVGKKEGVKTIPIVTSSTYNSAAMNQPYRFFLKNHNTVTGAYRPVFCNTSEPLAKAPKAAKKK